MIQTYVHLRDCFKSDAAQINLVLNNDRLSLAEALRIKNKLNDIGINIESVLVNKSQTNVVPAEVKDIFSHQKIALFPFSSENIVGYEAIRHYLDENGDIFVQTPR